MKGLIPQDRQGHDVKELDDRINELTNAIHIWYVRACPMPKKPMKQNHPWWNKDLAAHNGPSEPKILESDFSYVFWLAESEKNSHFEF